MSAGAAKKGTIVVPIDFSDCAKAALGRAVEVAKALGCEVRLVHVFDTSGLVTANAADYVNLAAIERDIKHAASADLERLAESADPSRAVIAGGEVLVGRPAAAIAEHADRAGARMIVMGTHGRTGLSRLLLGSVAERVVRLAHCDVMVVHHQ